ncbi:class I SAM-dependent methyltransferase [Rhodoferax sediminis]|uniref:Class I SAM-dependent methyltransferase n=1 Tax=Rhodoferax sediminis TaxID=2509614 RepID=A0A515DFE8_9BURK|nr:class I SAM-dependent methyltransferase [Rhodoferax sediminis]QDL39138.1 class I SAM-dependent methyltransferase [Rhodoferax sediminis]
MTATKTNNLDPKTVNGFGDEWERFDQSALPLEEQRRIFEMYFAIFPWSSLPSNAVGFDLGCGSGRWAKLVAPRVGHLHCIDPSVALKVAKRNLIGNDNCEFHLASVDSIPLQDASMDFGYSLGVLHHVPDTQSAITSCVQKLKPGAPFLTYLYYAFDNRPIWFRAIWKLSDIIRNVVSKLPHILRYWVSQIIAGAVYYPIAKLTLGLGKAGIDVRNIPLSSYKDCSFYTMRTDALDRFGTRLEQRFTRVQIRKMMERAGLERVEFSPNLPYWCAVGYRTSADEVTR